MPQNPNQPSSLLKLIVADLNKRRGQDEAPPVESLDKAEKNLAEPEERTEVQIVTELKDKLQLVEDVTLREDALTLVDELLELHGVGPEGEPGEAAVEEEEPATAPPVEDDENGD